MAFTVKQLEELKAAGKIQGFTETRQNPLFRTQLPRKQCLVCGNDFYCPPCMEKRGGNSGKFCSKKCAGVFLSEKLKEKYKDKREAELIEKENRQRAIQGKKAKNNTCPQCGSSCKQMFCNQSCYNDYRKANKVEGIHKLCLVCKKEIIVSVGQHNAGFGKYCSSSCASIDKVRNRTIPMIGNAIGGKREDLNNMYFRSRWEANYARYLNLLVKTGDILKWEYEVDTYYFEGIKRGTRSYTPDFKVFHKDGSFKYVEVKGYMNDRSRVQLKRMSKRYPQIKIEIVDTSVYKKLSKQLRHIIPNWEINNKKKI